MLNEPAENGIAVKVQCRNYEKKVNLRVAVKFEKTKEDRITRLALNRLIFFPPFDRAIQNESGC